jgi:hypothetical protein
MKNLSQESGSPGRDLNTGPPKYETSVLTTRPRHSVLITLRTSGACSDNVLTKKQINVTILSSPLDARCMKHVYCAMSHFTSSPTVITKFWNVLFAQCIWSRNTLQRSKCKCFMGATENGLAQAV